MPSKTEWVKLGTDLKSNAALKLRSKSGWKNNDGTNESGFECLPGGARTEDGYFDKTWHFCLLLVINRFKPLLCDNIFN